MSVHVLPPSVEYPPLKSYDAELSVYITSPYLRPRNQPFFNLAPFAELVYAILPFEMYAQPISAGLIGTLPIISFTSLFNPSKSSFKIV